MPILPQPARQSLLRLADKALARYLPGSCLLCGADSARDLLCPDCLADLPLSPSAACPQCGIATTFSERCGACLNKPPHFDQTQTLFRYEFPVDRIIQAFKYGHQLAIGHWLGRSLAEHINPAIDLIIPMPLHTERLRERGFNQSMEIAAIVGKCRKIRVDRSSLERIRATLPQASLPLKERQKNVRGAFECRHDMSGKHVLLIDDVMTTGATLDECARVLKLHGAAEVSVAVAARAGH